MPTPPTVAGRRFVVEVIDRATAAMFRAMTPAQRVQAMCDSHRFARQMAAGAEKSRHPDWTDEQIAREVARRFGGGTT